MATIDFEGTPVPFEGGDTIASALYRHGVRTFNRSLKYHRRRGLYCGTGDCPNCMVSVNGEPGARSCVTEARDGQIVERGTGWPNADRDVIGITDKLHWAMPVGFYYKAFVKPRFAWETAERIIRRATGIGRLPLDAVPALKRTRFTHADALVIGAGPAGLEAARSAASGGAHVIVAEEREVGWTFQPGSELDAVRRLADEVRALPNVELWEGHTAIGVYEGPTIPCVADDEMVEVEAGRVIVATGAVEAHGVFPGNDLPGVWLGRGAALMATRHGLGIGDRIVVATETEEGLMHAATLRAAGSQVMLLAPAALAERAPAGVQVLRDARVVEATGSTHVTGVIVDTPEGRRRIACHALVLSLGWAPRDALLRMGADLPVEGVGDVVGAAGDLPLGDGGYVCLCEDVGVHELEVAWAEGWTSSEILKRYTTATMGPCQGALCGLHLAAFAAARTDQPAVKGGRTTARPPVRWPRLEDLAGGVHETIERRTSLHDRHVALGARMDHSGVWMRPGTYRDVAEEIRAVRERVGVMDVGTLGKFLVAGRDAQTLLDRVLPTRLDDLAPGRARYLIALDEGGYVMDDGLICSLGDGRFYVTSTSGGADRMEAGLRNWADRWDLHVHLVNQTAQIGAINVAGPRARELLGRLSDDDLSRAAIPYPGHADITVAGVACRAIAVGFVGELSYELHHPRSHGPELWDALLDAGAGLGVAPHGLDALDVLRLEKGHFFLAQDTLPDDHPAKLGLGWAVHMEKPWFVGKASLERMAEIPLERKLVGLRFDGEPQRGMPLEAIGRIVGRVTSCARSDALGVSIGLGWVRGPGGEFPTRFRAGATTATVVPRPFYDPEGVRLRG